MRVFKYNKKNEQRDEIVLYAFSPEMLSASEDYMVEFLRVLSEYIPARDTPWSKESQAVDSGTPVHDDWERAYKHVSGLIKEKQESKRHWRLFWLSFISIFVLAAGLAYRVFISDGKVAELESRLEAVEKSALNQAMQPTANFVRILRGRCAPIIAQNAHKIGRV